MNYETCKKWNKIRCFLFIDCSLLQEKKKSLLNQIHKYKCEKEILIQLNSKNQNDNYLETKIIELQKEIENYKNVQTVYRKNCEELTKESYFIKEKLMNYGKEYSKSKKNKKNL